MPSLANAKHERFAQGLASGKTADEAYIAAGYSANRGNASTLKAKQNVQDRVTEILGRAADKVEITKERVLAELGRIGFSDIRKLFDDNGKMKHITLLDDDTAACISSIEIDAQKRRKQTDSDQDEHDAEATIKVKTWDKRAALADICKMMGWQVEKHEHTGKDGGPIEVADMTDFERARRIAFALTKGAKSAS